MDNMDMRVALDYNPTTNNFAAYFGPSTVWVSHTIKALCSPVMHIEIGKYQMNVIRQSGKFLRAAYKAAGVRPATVLVLPWEWVLHPQSPPYRYAMGIGAYRGMRLKLDYMRPNEATPYVYGNAGLTSKAYAMTDVCEILMRRKPN